MATVNTKGYESLLNPGTASSTTTKEAAKSAEEYAQFSQELSRLNATEAQQIQNWQADQLKQLDSYHARGLVKAGEYEFGKQAIMAESNRRLQKLNDDQWSEYLNGSSAALLKLKQQAQTQLTGPKQQIVVSSIDKKLKEQTFSDLPTIDAGSQTNEQNQIAQETPPRAWGRLWRFGFGVVVGGNTPTGVGKTRQPQKLRLNRCFLHTLPPVRVTASSLQCRAFAA